MSSNDFDSDSSCGYVDIKQVHFEPSVAEKEVPSYAKGVFLLRFLPSVEEIRCIFDDN